MDGNDEQIDDAGYWLGGHKDRAWTEAERAAKEADLRLELPGIDRLGASVTIVSAYGAQGRFLRFGFRRPLNDYQRFKLTKWLERESDGLNA